MSTTPAVWRLTARHRRTGAMPTPQRAWALPLNEPTASPHRLAAPHELKGTTVMNEDIEALNGRTVEVEQVHVTKDADGIPAWIKVERDLAGVVIVPSLLVSPTPRADTPAAPLPAQEGVTL